MLVQVKSTEGNKTVEMYAFLDPGSTDYFCTESLMNQLKISGRKTSILLKTMSDERPADAYDVSGLEVSSLSEHNFIALPNAFTRKTNPVNKENIPRQEDLKRWSYLNDVCIPEINVDVGLLIGANVHKAMKPWEVVNSANDGRYATRTRLGWIINGPLKGPAVSQQWGTMCKVSANRIAVARLDDLWQQQFKVDFPEREREEQIKMSTEDNRFMEVVKESATLVNGHYSLCLPMKNRMVSEVKNLDLEQDKLPMERALGMHWCIESDTF